MVYQIEHGYHVEYLYEPGIGARPDGVTHHHDNEEHTIQCHETDNIDFFCPLGIAQRVAHLAADTAKETENECIVEQQLYGHDRGVEIAQPRVSPLHFVYDGLHPLLHRHGETTYQEEKHGQEVNHILVMKQAITPAKTVLGEYPQQRELQRVHRTGYGEHEEAEVAPPQHTAHVVQVHRHRRHHDDGGSIPVSLPETGGMEQHQGQHD